MLKTISVLFLTLLFFSSCNGQVKTQSPKEGLIEQDASAGIHTKLFKTQVSTPYDNITCGLQDKEGNLWFGVAGGNIDRVPQGQGVYRYDGKTFSNFTVKDGLGSNCIRALLEDKIGNIWIGTNKGVCYYDGKSIRKVSKPVNLNYQPSNPGAGNPPVMNDVFSIMQDKRGVLWFGTADGIVCYDGNKFSNFLDDHTIKNDSRLSLKSVQCMFEDRAGNIWFGSGPMAFEGLCLYDGKSLRKFTPMNQRWILKIEEDKNGRLQFSTRGAGAISYDGTNFNLFPKPKELRNDILPGLFVDSKGNRWYTSDYINDNDVTTGGLWKFDGTSFTEFTKGNGLTNTAVLFMMEDRDGNLWLGTRSNGLYKYDGKKFTDYSE
ncbi:MAG: two-component regulator propeller domain-containing protein [Saprospiraceae bacterium]